MARWRGATVPDREPPQGRRVGWLGYDRAGGLCVGRTSWEQRVRAAGRDFRPRGVQSAVHPSRRRRDGAAAGVRIRRDGASTLEALWINRGKEPVLLRSLVTGQLACTHDAFDDLPESRTVGYLRALLVDAKILPPFDAELRKLEHWLRCALESTVAVDRAIIAQYARWAVLRKLKPQKRSGCLSRGSRCFAQGKIQGALALLAWLRKSNIALENCSQTDVDKWLEQMPVARKHVGPFFHWARKKRLIGNLHVSPEAYSRKPPSREDLMLAGQLMQRLLHDASIPIAYRCAGLFVLIYAQHHSKLVQLRLRDLTVNDGETWVHFSDRPVRLSVPVDGLVRTLLERRARDQRAYGPFSPSLFPGRNPGCHMSASGLGRQLLALGIPTNGARRSALFTLAREMSPSMLAALLGMSTHSAVAWTQLSQQKWAEYVGLRSADAAGASQ